jgi:hypothetical protein
VAEGGRLTFSVQSEVERDHADETLREDHGRELVESPVFERSEMTQRHLRRGGQLLAAYIAQFTFTSELLAELPSAVCSGHDISRNSLA